MSYRKPLIGLSLFLMLAIVVTSMVFVTLRREVSGSTNTYSAVFTDVSGLHPGDDVRVAGVRVGRVDAIDLVGTAAKVTFRVQKDQVLYRNTIASVTYQNIIGQRYLGLAQGDVQDRVLLPRDGQIPLEHTVPSFDIAYLLDGFEPLFVLLDPQQVDNLTNGIIQSLQGDSGSLLALITQTSSLAETFAGPDQILGGVIDSLNTVVTNLARQRSDIQTVIRQARQVMSGLANRRQELVGAVGSTNSAVGRLAAITGSVFPDLQSLIVREPGFTGHLAGDGRDRFAFFGANLPYLLKGFARASEDGARLNAYPCDLNITIFAFLGRLIPSIVEHATPGGVIQHTPMCR
ncbi:putative MCE family protein [Mycobacteroides stephanolepidis]|uniref:Putative MCE family protein n=1 Tax=[Mycobacterium] stephanolepidis TaxID=1520670 RepID=A0A1Z4ET98_9MYCO|nr:MCE family protein [[Mycobacterium] stephanolepidis]BAX96188.1 putative MCE family protein [[Mycobacterium] stephanolepidis]